ncbi:MAG: ABC transporter ATP-binding protein [Thermoprotei archaeon]|nr:MAG: ABC transporter ATP-binding protein [Thermoprotei archaeon]
MSSSEVILRIRDLKVVYLSPRGQVKAVDRVSLNVFRNEVLGIVGESGSGKSTLAHTILRILPPTARIVSGSILYDGTDIIKLPEREFKNIRWRKLSLVPQAALNALNPTMKILDHFIETGRAHGLNDRRLIMERAKELLELLRLEPRRVLNSYPHELSGGMKQRVLIALSMLLEPEILILDEPTTALDVLTQRAILDLLKEIKDKLRITMVFITHDIAVIADLADRIAVMYAGKLMEVGDVYTVFRRPANPYTKALMASIPSLIGKVEDMKPIPGSPPDLVNPPRGCRFHPRCPYAMEICKKEEPPTVELSTGHIASCWLYVKR